MNKFNQKVAKNSIKFLEMINEKKNLRAEFYLLFDKNPVSRDLKYCIFLRFKL